MITPTYRRIVDDIREKIRTGQLKPGDKLPTVEEMKAQYGTSSTAIRNAMLVLRGEGLVEGHQGKGVYVTDSPPNP